MRPFIFIALFFIIALPAFAADAPAPDVPKKSEVPFREDAGLITAEYYISVGKYAQALDVSSAVIGRHPDCADAYTYRGYAYEKLGDFKKAKENFAHAIEVNPTHLGANRYLAGLYLEEGDLARALDVLQVIRMVCGDVACQELDELQADINHYKSGQREASPGHAQRLAPDNRPYYQR